MNQRDQAISILRQARDRLANRLAERIVDSREEILEDAEGRCFIGGIEEIYDQLGSRLSHVSAMLSSLPSLDGANFSQTETTADDSAAMPSTVLDTASDLGSSSEEKPLPAPRSAPQLLAAPSTGSLRLLAADVESGDLEEAARKFAELTALDAARARNCVEHFAARLVDRPELAGKARTLSAQVASGAIHAALEILGDCFGLSGPESIAALYAMQLRVAGY
jgi:hypothetical protein